jgi:DNA-binding MarR family transcriptional regulator
MEEKYLRNFEGIYFTADIWLSKLPLSERAFIAEIKSLSRKNSGCYATNQYLAEFFQLSKKQVSRTINALIKKGIVTSKISCDRRRLGGRKRLLKIEENSLNKFLTGMDKNVHTPPAPMSIPPGHGCPDSIPAGVHTQEVYKEDNKADTKDYSKDDKGGGQKFSQKKLDSVLKKSTEFELKFCQIFPLRTKSERTTLQRIKNFFAAQMLSGKLEVLYFDIVLKWAKAAHESGSIKLFVAKCKEAGFTAQPGTLLQNANTFEVKNRRQMLLEQVKELCK